MVKMLVTKEAILKEMLKLKKEASLRNIKIGLAGSFARGRANKNSDIDIIMSYPKDIDDTSIILNVQNFISKKTNRRVDVLHLELLKEEDNQLDDLAIAYGLGRNEDSVYKTIERDVIWID